MASNAPFHRFFCYVWYLCHGLYSTGLVPAVTKLFRKLEQFLIADGNHEMIEKFAERYRKTKKTNWCIESSIYRVHIKKNEDKKDTRM